MRAFIEVQWVSGEYSGVEFPPAPTRLLQAMVASSTDEYVGLLGHLERKVPVIYATREYALISFTTYVVNNDERLEHNNAARAKKHVIRRANNLRVVYEYEIEHDFFQLFCKAASKIEVLGRAGDFVMSRASDRADVFCLDRFEPRTAGTVELYIPVAGFIDSVFASYKEHTALRLSKALYAKNPSSSRDSALFELTEPVPMELASHVVSWIRHAGMVHLPNLSGHGDHKLRLVITPVPTLDYRDNMIRRIIVTAPDLAAARNATAKLAGLHLTSDNGANKGCLVPADYDAVFSDYLAFSSRWATVTPIVAPYDSGKIRRRLRNFASMFEQAGLPVPRRISFISRCAHRFFVSKHHDRLPRFFAEVEFAKPANGVIAVGAGRYAGLGIFANLRHPAPA